MVTNPLRNYSSKWFIFMETKVGKLKSRQHSARQNLVTWISISLSNKHRAKLMPNCLSYFKSEKRKSKLRQTHSKTRSSNKRKSWRTFSNLWARKLTTFMVSAFIMGARRVVTIIPWSRIITRMFGESSMMSKSKWEVNKRCLIMPWAGSIKDQRIG